MKLSREELIKIIEEELKAVLEEGGFGSGAKLTKAQLRQRQRQRDDADRKRRRHINALGGEEMVSLSRGVVEAAEDEENCSVGNPSHKPANTPDGGRFTSSDKAGSWSIRKKGKANCRRGQYQKKFKGRDSEPCGRGHYRKCSTGKVDEDALSSDNDAQEQDYQELHYKYAKLQREHEELKQKHTKLVAMIKDLKSRVKGGMSWEQCLKQVDAVQRSSKGDLFKKK